MTIDQFIVKLDNFINNVDDMLLKDAYKYYGLDVSESIATRVRETGMNFTGNRFSSYSPFTLRKKKAQGKSILLKNFEDTGDMWRGFGVVSVNRDKTDISIILGGKNTDSQTKIDKNSKAEFYSIIKPSKAEIEDAQKNFIERFQKKLKLLFNG